MILAYKGNEFEQRDEDNYVNLTEMAKAFNKRVNDWTVNKTTQAYIEALSEETGILVSKLLFATQTTNVDRCTWAHPLVAIAFAQWLNPRFHVWCNLHIKHIIEQQAKPQVEVKVIELSSKEKLEIVKDSVGLLKLMCGSNLEKLDARDKSMYTAAINNINREVLYGSEKQLDPDQRPLSLTEIAQHIFGVRVKPGSKKGCDAHLGSMLVKRWQKKYNYVPSIKPEHSTKYMTRFESTTHQAFNGHELKGVYVYSKDDWHLVGELLGEYGYTVKQGGEFLLAAA